VALFAFAPIISNSPLLVSVFWGILFVVGVLGLVALVSPQAFASLAVRGGRWVDTSKVIAKLDARIDLDERVLPYSRVLGVAVIASVAVLGYVLTRV
jgi:hypothetical protein